MVDRRPRGDVHAFSDPDSNSGFLVTRHRLTTMHGRPERFFSRYFFTYGHRNVIRAVAAGLAQSGSVDGYVWEVVREVEPGSPTGPGSSAGRSWGFRRWPAASTARDRAVRRRRRARDDEHGPGRELLAPLRLDRFAASRCLFDAHRRRHTGKSGARDERLIAHRRWPMAVKVPLVVAVLMVAVAWSSPSACCAPGAGPGDAIAAISTMPISTAWRPPS